MKTFQDLKDAVETLGFEAESRLVALLKAIPLPEIGKGDAAFSQVKMFCEAMLKLPKEKVQHLHAVLGSCESVRDMLQTADMALMGAAVAAMEKDVLELEGGRDQVQSRLLAAFFQKHTVGAALLSWARQVLGSNEGAVAFDSKLEALKEYTSSFRGQGVSQDALTNQVVKFWEVYLSLQGLDGTPHQKLKLEGCLEDFWKCLFEGLTAALKNNLTGTMEIVFEAMENEGKVQGDTAAETEEVTMQGIKDLLHFKEVTQHVCWEKLAKSMPKALVDNLSVYKGLARDLGDMLQYVFSTIPACAVLFNGPLPENPSVGSLQKWLTSLPKLAPNWLDDNSCLTKCEEKCFQVVRNRVQNLSLTTYTEVGELVLKVLEGKCSSEANVAALKEVKTKLPVGSEAQQLLDVFLEVLE